MRKGIHVAKQKISTVQFKVWVDLGSITAEMEKGILPLCVLVQYTCTK